MATFQARIEGITQLTLGSGDAPSINEANEFLKDGVLEVTDKWLIGHPQDVENFQRSSSGDSQGINVGGARIISVIREAGIDGSSDGTLAWKPCRRVSAALQSLVLDAESLYYASKYNPVYTLDDNRTINVYPRPAANNGFKVFYVNVEPLDVTNSATLTTSHSNIKYFPNDKVYLVVLYASIQTLQAAMSNSLISLSITSPATPVLTAVTFTSIDSALDASAPVFTTATVSAASTYSVSGSDDPGAFSLNAVPPSIPSDPSFSTISIDGTVIFDETIGTMPTVSSTTISSFGSAPAFVPPSLGVLDFAQVTTYIDTDQDTELAGAKLQELSTEINEFTARLQSSLNVFNEENVAYQAEVQQNIQQAQVTAREASQQAQLDASKVTEQARLGSQTKQSQAQIDAQVAQQETSLKLQKETQEYAAEIQKYGALINAYQADVNKEVQQYTQKLQRWQLLYQSAIQESFKEVDIANGINISKAQADLQLALANKDRDLQRQLQNGVNDMQAINSDNQNTLARYQAEVADYQAEVAKEIQESTTKMQQYQGLYIQLLQQYNGAFQVAQPQQAP